MIQGGGRVKYKYVIFSKAKILRDCPLINWHVRFTTVFFKSVIVDNGKFLCVEKQECTGYTTGCPKNMGIQ